MDIASLTNISSAYVTSAVQHAQNQSQQSTETQDGGFDSVLKSAMNILNETSQLQNAAESAQVQFALGESDNTHDLAIAQQKANVALQYTVAVRDRAMDAYKEIMNMNI